ncbi:MAG: LLM class flavin-dependent oxidoreductase [Chloroflexota bacterium]|nr:LLM class flavin-dependent oxidoreductase [Chloroflexota bacterium]
MVRPLRFGISVTPYAADYPRIVEAVMAAEEVGLDLVGIQDHPYQRRFLDTYVLMADLLARTHRLRFFPDVTSLPMREPPMIAKAAVSLDVMSGGRFELGLGAGAFWDAVAGMGGTRRTNAAAFDALEEAMTLIRAALDTERVVRGDGPHYPVPGYPAGPPPVHRVGIWLGVYRRRGLELVGRRADGWVPSLGRTTVGALAAASRRIDEAARAAGRHPDEITRVLNLGGAITDGARGDDMLTGPPDHWAGELERLATEADIDSFVFWAPENGVDQVRRFAEEVVPSLRSRLGR